MTVLIKGMEMPENCYQCRFYNSPCAQCKIIGRTYMNTSNQPSIRPEWCPLIEVPTPHGRLIDADSLIAEHEEAAYSHAGASYGFHMAARSWVMQAPTIIEAEVEE